MTLRRRKYSPTDKALGEHINKLYEDAARAFSSIDDQIEAIQEDIATLEADFAGISTTSTSTTTIITSSVGEVSASYLVLSATSSLANERVFTPGTGLKATDSGANAAYTLNIDDRTTATVSGTRFTGPVTASSGLLVSSPQGITGTITKNAAGKSYLVGGNGITVTSGSNDQIVFNLVSNRSPYTNIPSSPDSWNLETSTWTDPDIANNGWTITLLDSPWTTQTRAADVDFTTSPAANTYRSTLMNGMLCLQFVAGSPVTIYKSITTASFSYKGRFWHTDFPNASNGSILGIATSPQRLSGSTRTYYNGIEGPNMLEYFLTAPSTFSGQIQTAMLDNGLDAVKTINYAPGGGGTESSKHYDAINGRMLMTGSSRSVTMAPAYCVLWFYANTNTVYWLDFVRRTTNGALP